MARKMIGPLAALVLVPWIAGCHPSEICYMTRGSYLAMPSRTTDIFNHLWRTLRNGYQTVAELDVIDLVPRLTLLTLLFSPMGDPGVRPFGLLLAGVGVLFAPAAR